MCPHEVKLTAWLLGDLPPAEREEMTRHVEGCAACRAAAEELSCVLTPLRSGLAKDSRLRIESRTAGAVPRRTPWAWLLHSPHEGLKRAALLAVSFGTLFALISTLYQSAQREAAPADAVTNIEFKKRADEAVPVLEPLAAPKEPETAASILSKDAGHLAAPLAVENKTVPYPKPPAAAPSMPPLRRLPAAAAKPKAAAAPAEAVPAAAAAAPFPRKSVPKTEGKRERAKTAPVSRPPPDLRIKPPLLAGAALVSTNAAPTNAVPTNAIAPKVKNAP